MLGSSLFACSHSNSSSAAFGTFFTLLVRLLVLVPSPTPLTHFASPHFIRLLDQLRNQFVASSSASQLRLKLRCRFLGWSGECAQTYRICTQLDNGHSHNHRITEGAETEVRRHSQTRSSAAGDRDHQPQ